MKKIRLSEIFASFQGEGRFTGLPSLWVRFFGCNLQCNGFGQSNPCDPSTYVLPYQTLDVSKYKTMSELPVFDKGCDSSYSWDSRFKRLAKDYTVEEIVDELDRLGKEDLGLSLGIKDNYCWRNQKTGTIAQLCFTGGEPMLNQKAMASICSRLSNVEMGVRIPQITIETNGTIPIDDDDGFNLKPFTNHLHISCSPKLYSVSGEYEAVDLGVLAQYMNYADSGALKFVHNGTQEAWDELDTYVENLRLLIKNDPWQFFIMPVGSVLESQDPKFLAPLVTESLKRGFWVSHRAHISIFGNQIGT